MPCGNMVWVVVVCIPMLGGRGTGAKILQQVPEPSNGMRLQGLKSWCTVGVGVGLPAARGLHGDYGCKADYTPNSIVQARWRYREPKGWTGKMRALVGGKFIGYNLYYSDCYRAGPKVVKAIGPRLLPTHTRAVLVEACRSRQAIIKKAPENFLVVVVPPQAPELR